MCWRKRRRGRENLTNLVSGGGEASLSRTESRMPGSGVLSPKLANRPVAWAGNQTTVTGVSEGRPPLGCARSSSVRGATRRALAKGTCITFREA